MIAEGLVLAVLPVLLALAAGWDIASFTIPNFIPATMLAAFAVFAVVAGLPLNAVGVHLLVGFIGLAISFTLFSFGFIGGGDAKFFACILLWLGNVHDVMDYTLVVSLAGGGLSLLLLSLRSAPLPGILVNRGWIARLHNPKSGIPYGVALGAGALLVLPYTDVFRLAARV
jgi:prepilin peptidase CpaA